METWWCLQLHPCLLRYPQFWAGVPNSLWTITIIYAGWAACKHFAFSPHQNFDPDLAIFADAVNFMTLVFNPLGSGVWLAVFGYFWFCHYISPLKSVYVIFSTTSCVMVQFVFFCFFFFILTYCINTVGLLLFQVGKG